MGYAVIFLILRLMAHCLLPADASLPAQPQSTSVIQYFWSRLLYQGGKIAAQYIRYSPVGFSDEAIAIYRIKALLFVTELGRHVPS
jgi:hypothetical protein